MLTFGKMLFMEDTQQLKQELIEKISNINQWDILMALREDVQVYETQQKTVDPYEFPGATEEEKEELIKEDNDEISIEEDMLTHEDFKKAMRRWLTE